MNMYRVTWGADIQADSPHEAVRLALQMMRERKTSQTALQVTEWKPEDIFSPSGEETTVTVRKAYILSWEQSGQISSATYWSRMSALQAMDDLRQMCVEKIMQECPEAWEDEMVYGEVEDGEIEINPKYAKLCGISYIRVDEAEDIT